ncbi:serine hydrolase domain-containing protein [Leifsonia sp. NCR5]|uniref:serine hydrolase domain-containing protein n=1 Tax=Leifsonia sp. NCR5 TaxID=1978342 RepID=UPI000A197AFA|nr:serine hydrolase domain-containing protein [Leifsonia sp. NCR5]
MSLFSSTAVLVAINGETTVERYGAWHDRQTPVAWASISKLLTSAAVQALMDTRAFDAATSVREFLTSAPPTLTVGALVEHRSGLARCLPEQEADFDAPYEGWSSESFDDQVIPRLPALMGRPSQYSNLGYALLARVIEVASCLPLLDAVRTFVIVPSGIAGNALSAASRDADVCRAKSVTGAVLHDWSVTGPWVAAAGFASSPPTLASIVTHQSAPGGLLDPRRTPRPWLGEAPRFFHDGALRHSGCVVAADIATGGVAVAHALGGPRGTGNILAASALKSAIRRGRR